MTKFVIRGDKPQEPVVEMSLETALGDGRSIRWMARDSLGNRWRVMELHGDGHVERDPDLAHALGLQLDSEGRVQVDGCLTPEQQAAIDGLVGAVESEDAIRHSSLLEGALAAYREAFDAKGADA